MNSSIKVITTHLSNAYIDMLVYIYIWAYMYMIAFFDFPCPP